MKILNVYYSGWGEDWLLGRLADDGRNLLFEYSQEVFDKGVVLSPIHLGLRRTAFGGFPAFQHRLPGFIADSLPDGWGLLLMDRFFRQSGLMNPGPLDRLAFIGNRAMGALRFEPADDLHRQEPEWNLSRVASESQKVLEGEASETLRELILTGGSPQGARPKALVQYDASTGQTTTRSDGTGEPWLFKFPARHEHWEVCAIEAIYADLARECGMDMPPSAYFQLSPKQSAFGVARFDREQGMRVPIHSLAGLLHVDFRIPGATHYGDFLRSTYHLTHDLREVLKGYSRTVFNAVFHNRDDHPRNFAWRFHQDKRWYLAPAFDLTFSDGPGGQHHMDICGEGAIITRSKLRELAIYADIPLSSAEEMMERICTVAGNFAEKAKDYPVRRQTIRNISKMIERCRHLLL